MKHLSWIALAVVGAVLCSGGVPAAYAIGPGFDCSKATQPLARLICADPELSRIDLRFNQGYQALRQQLGTPGRQQLNQEDLEFLDYVKRSCGVPETGAVAGSPGCVGAQYDRKREDWISRLSGPAREEATRPIERHVDLQGQLQQLGFLPATAKIDGVYSAATRSAILAWQSASGRPGTGFMGDADAASFVERHQDEPGSLPAASTPVVLAQPTAYQSVAQTGETAPIPVTPIAFVTGVIATIIIFIILVKWRNNKHKKQVSTRLVNTITGTISLHSHALLRKRYQTLIHDAYGNLVRPPWEKEISYFIETVLRPAIQAVGYEEYAVFETIRPGAVALIDRLVEEEAERAGTISFGPNLSPSDFEHFCAEQLRLRGWEARTTKASGDQGSDIIAERNGLRLVVQCKLYTHPVGNKAVQEVVAARAHEQAEYAAVVTNSRYTTSAQQLAATNGVLLLHHSDLQEIDKHLELQDDVP